MRPSLDVFSLHFCYSQKQIDLVFLISYRINNLEFWHFQIDNIKAIICQFPATNIKIITYNSPVRPLWTVAHWTFCAYWILLHPSVPRFVYLAKSIPPLYQIETVLLCPYGDILGDILRRLAPGLDSQLDGKASKYAVKVGQKCHFSDLQSRLSQLNEQISTYYLQ